MTYTLSISLRGTETTTSHETAEEAQAEALMWDAIAVLTLSGPLTSVSMIHPSRNDLHDLADHMESAEVNACDAWGCYA